jgi:hypothetical protein
MCDESFTRTWDRKRHEKRMHGIGSSASGSTSGVSPDPPPSSTPPTVYAPRRVAPSGYPYPSPHPPPPPYVEMRPRGVPRQVHYAPAPPYGSAPTYAPHHYPPPPPHPHSHMQPGRLAPPSSSRSHGPSQPPTMQPFVRRGLIRPAGRSTAMGPGSPVDTPGSSSSGSTPAGHVPRDPRDAWWPYGPPSPGHSLSDAEGEDDSDMEPLERSPYLTSSFSREHKRLSPTTAPVPLSAHAQSTPRDAALLVPAAQANAPPWQGTIRFGEPEPPRALGEAPQVAKTVVTTGPVAMASDRRRTREAKYVCDICGRALTTKTNLEGELLTARYSDPCPSTEWDFLVRPPKRAFWAEGAQVHGMRRVIRPRMGPQASRETFSL